MTIIFDKSKKISLDDESFRSELLSIASKIDDVIPLGRGDPDFHTPKHIVDAAKKALDDNKHHYTPPNGLPELRFAISKNLLKKYNLNYSENEIVVTAGVQESIALAMLSLLETGDEVLITSPRFTTYDLNVRMCNAKPIPIPTYEKNNFSLMPEIIESKINERTKVIVLVSPNNPTGAVTPPENIRKIAEIAIKHNLIVIADEIYADLIYENHQHLSIGTLENMKERTLTLNGFSKTYAMTGWRIGYGIWPKNLIQLATRLAINYHSCVSSISQFGGIAALTGSQEPVRAMVAKFRERRDLIVNGLNQIPGFECPTPGGAFYAFPNIENTGYSSTELQNDYLEKAGVAVISGSSFGHFGEGYLRFSYANSHKKIIEAIERLKKFS